MGSSLVIRTFEKCEAKELKEKVDNACHEAASNCGRNFSGDWGDKVGCGLTISNKTFSSSDDVEGYFEINNGANSDPLLAVKSHEGCF